MPIIATGTDGKDFTPAPEGLFDAVCCDVLYLGMKPTAYGEKHKVRFHWELAVLNEDDRDKETDEAKRHTVVKTYNLTLGKGSTLRGDLESWRGQPFTPEELQGFDLEVCIGKCCKVLIEHNMVDGGKTYANVTKVLKPEKGATMEVSPHYVRFQDREQANGEGGFNGDDGVPF